MAINLIVGAGLTGLTAASAMVRNGVIPLIIERDSISGGMAKSFRLNDQIFDLGVHHFRFPSDSELRNFLVENLRGFKPKTLHYVLNVQNKKIPGQPTLLNYIKYPASLKADLIWNRRNKSRGVILLSEKLKFTYGKWLYDNFFRHYIEKKIPILDKRNIHSDWWSTGNKRDEFNRFLPPSNGIQHKARSSFSGVAKRLYKFTFGKSNPVYYHINGIGEIANRLETLLLQKGVEIFFNTTMLDIKSNRLGNISIKLSNGKDLNVNNLIWTGLIVDLAKLLGIPWPDDLKFLDTILVYLNLRKNSTGKQKNLFEYCASDDTIFSRFYVNDYFFESKDVYGICAEISSSNDIAELPEEVIFDKTIKGLRAIGAINNEIIIAKKIVKAPNSHPLYPANYRELLEKFCMSAKKYGNIFLAGRNGSFNNLTMPASMTMGWKIGTFCSQNIEQTSG